MEDIKVLEKKLENAQGKEKTFTLVKITRYYIHTNPQKAVETAESAIKYEKKRHPDNIHPVSYLAAAEAYNRNAQFEKAEKYAYKSLELIRKKYAEDKDLNPEDIKNETEKFLKKVSAENLRILGDIYNDLGFINWNFSRFEESKKFYVKSLSYKIRTDDKKGIADEYNNIGIIYYRNSNYEKSLDYFNKAFEINQEIGNDSNIILSYHNLGLVYWKTGNYTKSLEYFHKTYDIMEEKGTIDTAGNLLANIGNVYYDIGDYRKAGEFYSKALEIGRKNQNKRVIGMALNNLGAIYLDEKNYGKALHYYQKALDIKREIHDKIGIAVSLNNIGLAYEGLLQYEQALEILEESLSVRKLADDIWGTAYTYKSIAGVYIKMRNYLKAEEYLRKGSEIAEDIKSKKLMVEFDSAFSELYETQKDFEKAFEYSQKYAKLKNEIYDKELTDKIAEMHTKYETVKKEKEAEIYRLKNIELVEANELLTDRNDEILEQKKKLEELNKKLNESNASKDKFFSIIAHDLRSPIDSILSFINMMNLLSGRLSKKRILELTFELNSVTKNASVLLENLLNWSRSQTNTLQFKPEYINLKKVSDESIILIEKQAESKDISVINLIEPNLKVYGDANMLLTIFRNLTSNAVKFTYPGGKIILNSERVNDYTEVLVTDTGIGIPENILQRLFRLDDKITSIGTENEKGFGLGLILCREFIQKMGGEISADSEEGRGSVFRFTIPNRESKGLIGSA